MEHKSIKLQKSYKEGKDYIVMSSKYTSLSTTKNIINKRKMLFVFLERGDVYSVFLNPTKFSRKYLYFILSLIDKLLHLVHIHYKFEFRYKLLLLGLVYSSYIYMYTGFKDFEAFRKWMSDKEINHWYAPANFKRGII